MLKDERCCVCGASGAVWVVRCKGVVQSVHRSCGEKRLEGWLPPNAKLEPSAALKARWEETDARGRGRP